MGQMDCMVCNMCKRIIEKDKNNKDRVVFYCIKNKDKIEVSLYDTCHFKKENETNERC